MAHLLTFLKESKTESIGKDGDENKDFKPAVHIRTGDILLGIILVHNLYLCLTRL